MAAVTIAVPQEYGYTLVTATASFFLAFWHGMRIGSFRKAARVPYPYNFATPEQIATATTAEQKQALYLFNCAQRAHYNFLENYVTAMPAMLIGGLAYPRTAAISGGLWCVFRVLYATGYTDPKQEKGKGRYNGVGFWLAQLVLFGLVGKMGVDMILA